MPKPYLSVKEFKEFTDKTKILIEEKVLFLRLSGFGGINIVLDEDIFSENKILNDNQRIAFKSAYLIELRKVLFALFADNPEEFLENIISNYSTKSKKEPKENFLEKMKYVNSKIVTKSLRQRINLKEVTKLDTLDLLSWDVSVKRYDNLRGAIENVPFATVLFKTNPLVTVGNFFLASSVSNEKNSFRIEMHIDDVRQLIDELQNVVKVLDKLNKEVSNDTEAR